MLNLKTAIYILFNVNWKNGSNNTKVYETNERTRQGTCIDTHSLGDNIKESQQSNVKKPNQYEENKEHARKSSSE